MRREILVWCHGNMKRKCQYEACSPPHTHDNSDHKIWHWPSKVGCAILNTEIPWHVTVFNILNVFIFITFGSLNMKSSLQNSLSAKSIKIISHFLGKIDKHEIISTVYHPECHLPVKMLAKFSNMIFYILSKTQILKRIETLRLGLGFTTAALVSQFTNESKLSA